MSLEITEELIARQTPEEQAIIRALLATIRQLQDKLNQSPRNSSVPPSTEHPHAKPPRPKSRAARAWGGQPATPSTRVHSFPRSSATTLSP
jgi:transposase